MPFENFNKYTEYDEGNDVTVESATKVSWINLKSRSETAYLVKNFGYKFFNGDFTHKFEMSFSNMGNVSLTCHWMLGSALGDLKYHYDNFQDAVVVRSYDDTENITASFIEEGVAVSDNWAPPGPQPSTNYFITVVRDDDGGDNGTGLLIVSICTVNYYGQARSNLEDTLVVHASVGEQNDYSFAYALATFDDGNVFELTCDGYTQNLDFGLPTVLRRRIEGY